jgi:autotransporter-associated beta strand protein
MPMGDSITVGYTNPPNWTYPYEDGYRYDLYTQLTNAGLSIQYVGNSGEPWNGVYSIPPNTPTPDLRAIGEDNMEGFTSYQTGDILRGVVGWVSEFKPNVILLDVGINDIGAGSATVAPEAESNLTSIVQDVIANDPGSHLIVAQITPFTTLYEPLTGAVIQYDAWIRDTLVPEYAAQGVSTVDLYTPMTVNGLPNAGLYANGFTHPNEGGYAQLANAWFNAVASLEGIPQRVTATWDNAGGTGDGKTWDVAASQNWNNGVPAQFNQSDNVMFNDANNGNYSVTLNSTVAPTLVTFANNSGNYVLSGTGSIGGAANIFIDGAGTVTLNISNSYSGATSVNEGTLVITNAAALPASTQLTIGNGLTPVAMKLATGIGLASVATLAMNADATLDITNNSLAIN